MDEALRGPGEVRTRGVRVSRVPGHSGVVETRFQLRGMEGFGKGGAAWGSRGGVRFSIIGIGEAGTWRVGN